MPTMQRGIIARRVRNLVESEPFQGGITIAIIVNAAAIGALTLDLPTGARALMSALDALCLCIYVVEITLKLVAYRLAYFKSRWNVFDFVVVIFSLAPLGLMPVQIARMMRVFRMVRSLRLFSAFREIRVILEALFKALPGVMWTAFLLAIIYYIFGVSGVYLFGEDFPEYFGSLGKALYTLFQVMTLDSWNGIARPVMDLYSWAWLYFAPFVVVSAFVVLNIVVGIIVDALGHAQEVLSPNGGGSAVATTPYELEFAQMKEHLVRIEAALEAQGKLPPIQPEQSVRQLDNLPE